VLKEQLQNKELIVFNAPFEQTFRLRLAVGTTKQTGWVSFAAGFDV
jgi:hypothetical protein